jgi:hypothetical protein
MVGLMKIKICLKITVLVQRKPYLVYIQKVLLIVPVLVVYCKYYGFVGFS